MGEVLAALMLEMLMSSEAQRRANLPLRGRCRRQKGCISSGPQARLYGFRCLRQRCRQRRHIKLIAAKRRYHNPRPAGPSNLRTFGAKAPSNFRTLRSNASIKNSPAHHGRRGVFIHMKWSNLIKWYGRNRGRLQSCALPFPLPHFWRASNSFWDRSWRDPCRGLP